jgi:hypothetical protein
MWFWIPVFRSVLIWALAVWLGGFTFYSAVVIPVLHDQLGSPTETGLVTQRVTDVLNFIGFVVIVVAWIGVGLERSWARPDRWTTGLSLALLSATSVCLIALLALHRVMDRMMISDSMTGFYSLHRVYLWVSVLQWLANLGLMAAWADVRGSVPYSKPKEESSSFPISTSG